MNDALERALNPAQFARVWQRVAAAGDACPVEVVPSKGTDVPPGGAAEGSEAYLRQRVDEELRRWRSCQGLTAFPCHSPALHSLSRRAYRRARRLAAALFLPSGGWYFPAGQTRPRRWSDLRTGLRDLYQGSQRTEQEDRQAAEAAPDPLLRELLLSLAEESREEQRMICQMLERSHF